MGQEWQVSTINDFDDALEQRAQDLVYGCRDSGRGFDHRTHLYWHTFVMAVKMFDVV